MSIPLHLRLTFFYALIVGLALWFFGTIVYNQAYERAYRDIDSLLQTRAASVRMGKALATNGSAATDKLVANPLRLPSVDALGTGGVSIEVLDSQLRLLASTSSSSDGIEDVMQPSIQNLGSSPVPWDEQAALEMLGKKTITDQDDPLIYKSVVPSKFKYSDITYQGQHIRVFTLLNSDFGSPRIIQTARTLTDTEQSLNNLRNLLIYSALFVLLLALGGGWLISWSVLRAVQHMTRTAQVISASHDFSKRVPGQSVRGRDELGTLAATFNQMLSSLEEVYQRQQRFIADASHELRAPITSIRCNLDLLAKAPDLPAEEVQAALSDARTEAERMGRLVNDLLLLAHADATQQGGVATAIGYQKAQTYTQEVDLDSLLLDVFRQYRRLENGSDENMPRGPRLSLQHTLPARVYGDADQLKQAIVALVDNALKYTPQEGHASLSLSVRDGYAVVKVSDTGIGILPADLPYIFERFYRADRARTCDRGGSGLGLAIVESILQDHRGSIEVESKAGKGSTFTIKLPVAREKS